MTTGLGISLTVSTAGLAGAAPPRASAVVQAKAPDFATEKTFKSVGRGGAVSSVDPEASRIGLEVLRKGGNAVDAAVATAAALGVTEPYSAGIGGGGYFLYYDAKSDRVHTLDGRETAPASMPRDAFIDPDTDDPYPFSPERVTSGVSVGVPGTAATWDVALRKWGSRSLAKSLKPAARLAARGFVVDDTFALQTEENQTRFEAFTSTPKLFLPGGEVPEAGSVFRNPDLAATYRTMAAKGVDWLYGGKLGREVSAVVQSPPTAADTDLPVPAGFIRPRDMRDYTVLKRRATAVEYRGLDVFGMPPSSSGGTTVGEALNILEEAVPDAAGASDVEVLHGYLEASALAFADRGAYLGDPAYTPVPTKRLLDQVFAAERACEFDPDAALTKPVDPGDVEAYDGDCDTPTPGRTQQRPDTENRETTNLTVVDRKGNVVEYTLTIEQTGGSGMVVPDRGFLLNNELTDFSAVWDPQDPNRIEGGKRPRSSMSPTIVTRNGHAYLALGSPGGSTIITTVLQVLVNFVDLDQSLGNSVRSPRATQRNTTDVVAEQLFLDEYAEDLGLLGHTFAEPGEPGTSAAEIGAATAIRIRPTGVLTAVSEPTRRGGGSALVVKERVP